MKHSIRTLAVMLCAVFLAGSLSACGGTTPAESAGTGPQELTGTGTAAPETAGAAVITFSGTSAAAEGAGAEVTGGTVTITAGGTYVVTGTAAEGRVIVNAPGEEVILVLQNADITCADGSPLYGYKAARLTVYLAEGSENTLTDGGSYSFSDSCSSAAEEEPNACLYAKSDLVIAGSGALTVRGNYNNGITGKDTLTIEAADLTVTARNHGITGKDCCTVQNAALRVECGGDALRATNTDDSTLGNIVITDSILELTAGEDGIQAETALTVAGGSCTVQSGGGSGARLADNASAKGLKAGTSLVLAGGNYDLDCCDDAIHSDGSVRIDKGDYVISTGDDGIHAEETLTVADGSVDIRRSSEGLEGLTVEITGGSISIVASDDGINAADGSGQSGIGGRPGAFGVSSGCAICISGGVITVDAGGDGIDSNGDIAVSGGELFISGSTGSGNSAIDCDGNAVITGGTVVAVGSGGMAQNFGADSTQGCILLSYPSAALGPITLQDETGRTLVSYTPGKGYNCVVISCPAITQGSTYTVTACGQTASVTMSSLIYGSGGMGGGPGGRGDMSVPGGKGGMGGPAGRP